MSDEKPPTARKRQETIERSERIVPDEDVVEIVAKELQSEYRARGLGQPGEPSVPLVRKIVAAYLNTKTVPVDRG